RLAVDVEVHLRDAGRGVAEARPVEIRVTVIRVLVLAEVAIHDGQVQRGRQVVRRRTREAGLHLVPGGAAVAVLRGAVVGGFADDQAVAAPRHAGAALAVRLGLPGRATAIVRLRVAVVAALRAFLVAVAAGRVCADAGRASAIIAEFEGATR